jgi:hypothetical protein
MPSKTIDRFLCINCDDTNNETSMIVGLTYSKKGLESIQTECSVCSIQEIIDPDILENDETPVIAERG